MKRDFPQILAVQLHQSVLKHVEKGHITLFQTKTEIFICSVGIVDEDFDLNVFFDSLLEDILQEGEHVWMVGAEAA